MLIAIILIFALYQFFRQDDNVLEQGVGLLAAILSKKNAKRLLISTQVKLQAQKSRDTRRVWPDDPLILHACIQTNETERFQLCLTERNHPLSKHIYSFYFLNMLHF